MLDFAQCEQLVSRARDKRSKPVANNTRVERRDADTYALRLHGTDIATYHRDGTITLNSGGWRTVTTLERLRSFTGVHIESEHGYWYVQAEPDPADPKPARGERSVLKPFHALDPGPEPVKPTEGCIAGTEEVREYDEDHLVSKHEIGPSTGWTEEDIVRPYEHESDYFVGYVRRHRRDVTRYGEQSWGDRPTTGAGGCGFYKQCPHCKLFAEQHYAWEAAMHGGGWGRNRTHGYKQMCEALERYGSREAWQEAYIADFRQAREQRKLYKAWVERNRVSFEDDMEVTADGYAVRPNQREIARQASEHKRAERMQAKIDKYVKSYVWQLTTNGLPMPSGGDCWGCALRDRSDPGLEPMGTGHLLDHLREHYYVPSLAVNALRERGYKDAGIYIFLGMSPEGDTMGGPNRRVEADNVSRALRAYLRARLVPTASGSAPTGAARRETGLQTG